MRILVIMPEQLPVPPILGGSVESCTHNTFRRMARTDTITLLSRRHHRLSVRNTYLNGRYTIVRVPGGNRHAYIRAVLRAMRNHSFDIIQIENRPTFVPLVRKLFPRTPIVLSLHSLTFMSALTRQKAHGILRQVQAVTSVVHFVSRTMKKRYPSFAHKFHTCILGVDTRKFRPRSAAYRRQLRKKWRVSGSFNVLFVGRIVRRKGLHTLVQAVAQVKRRYPNTRLIAVGSSWPGVSRQTSYMRSVRSLSKKLGVPVRFTGYIPPDRVHRAFQLADVFVCPTQYREGFATVNSEAMASGIPVIASDRGGIREVVQHGHSGLLIRSYKSPDAFARAILLLKQSTDLARRLAANGRRRVKARFSWTSTASRYKRVYRQIRARG